MQGERMQQIFFVGSYTHPSMEGRGQGIYTCALEPSTGQMTHVDTFVTTNPSYLALDKSKQYLFAVEESSADMNPVVQSFKITANRSLEPLSEQPIPGEIACHLELDADDRFLAVANYGTGDVILYELKDGHLTRQLDTVQHVGKSVNEERQEGPHAHATVLSPDKAFLLVTDLGLDEVKTYKFNSGKLELYSTFKTKPGAGPRHLVFHPNGRHAFIVNELDSTVTLVGYKDGTLSETLTMSTLPENHAGEKWAAAIHVSPNGKNVYVSNRVHDSIAVFAFDEARENLEVIQHIASGGHIPRDFSLDPTGKLLVTAHQNSDDLFSFWVDETGRLKPTGHSLKLGTPVCVKML
jgi:6-phosphogluconolactonase